MFYEGDLRSGINTAIHESKLVACFVRDDGPESATWEEDFLADEELATQLSAHTILLKMVAGGEEAGFLAALCPLPKTPTFVVIQNGQLKEYLTAGTSKEVFIKRIKALFGDGTVDIAPVTAESESDPRQSDQVAQVISPAVASSSSSASPSSSTGQNTPSAEESQSQAVQDVLSERRTRLEAQKKKQDAAEKAKRAAAAAERKAALEASTPENSQKAADMKYALQFKKRQQEARDERARILKRVEDDKAERREKEALRKEQAAIAADNATVPPIDPAELFSSKLQRPSSSKATECAVQVRLFDGSTIRSRFPSNSTLSQDIRKWVDSQRRTEEDIPYNFKQVLTPLPNRNLSISDEEESLQALGLAPSATLILVPVKDYTSAYEGSGVTGLVTKGASAGYGLVSSGVGMVTGLIGSLLGSAPVPPAQPGSQGAQAPPAEPPSINVRTLRDQRRPQDDQQFYNGNALNFEPRRDDNDKED